MGAPEIGNVVLVRFPFSDLSAIKLRPAVVLAGVDRDDWILCQITSNPLSDSQAVTITEEDFSEGGLHRVSFARPGKLFCANSAIMHRAAGTLKKEKFESIIDAVIRILRGGI